MRIHPISRALRALRGERSLHGKPLPTKTTAAATLRRLTGRDFGTDAALWGAWLRDNRWVYTPRANDPRLACARRIQQSLDRYRRWVRHRKLKKGRLVQYWDPDTPTASDVPLAEVEREIEGLIGDGFRVDWAEHDAKVYLLVYESRNLKPDWPQVFDETW